MEQLKKTAQTAIAALKANGADKAKCDVGYSITHEFNVDGGEFSLFRTLFDKHLVLTAIKDGKKGTVRQNRYDEATVASLAAACLDTAASSVSDPAWDIAPLTENHDFTFGVVNGDQERLFARCRELMDDVASRYPKILMEQMIVTHKEIGSVHANTNGVLQSEHCGYYSVELMFSAHEGEKSSSFFSSGFMTDHLDTPFIDCGSVAADLASVEKQIDTELLDGKFEGVLLLPPAATNAFLYYSLSNFVGDGALLQGTSPWKDQLGKVVADPAITLTVAPLDDRMVCGDRVTSDGLIAENYDILRDGVLNQFAISQYVANKTGLTMAPNGASTGNLILKAGERSLDEIIASIDRGILVGRFSGGNPSSNGDFSGVAKNSFLIENGKITKALSETMISGNLATMMQNLYAISRETVSDGNSVLPYTAFRGITVSGK
ncbi:MAG: TldD/PmbA family protein [Ruminococcaceae bacterium]|nr:TldD/PmbA family protein [Oscillospiraceae bacterium]